MTAVFPPASDAPVQHPQDPTAVFGRRVVAGAIDLAVVGIPGFAIASSAFKSYDLSGSGMDGTEFCDAYLEQEGSAGCVHVGDTAYFTDEGFDATSLAPLTLAFLLFVVIQGLTGWTVGKLLTGLRTVQADGSTVGLGKAFLRWIMWVVDGLPCFALVGLITAGTSTGHRRVGDIVARTYVVGKGAVGRPVTFPGSTPSYVATPPEAWGQPSAPATPAAPASEPQWDAARGTYIQWDAGRARWLQWDDAARTWVEIPGQ